MVRNGNRMKLNELFGTEFPLIQGGMANIATGEFAAAVSNAGALGLVGAGGMNATRAAAGPYPSLQRIDGSSLRCQSDADEP